ncbi:hypothetical protein D3C73_477370 [compost metagenome]
MSIKKMTGILVLIPLLLSACGTQTSTPNASEVTSTTLGAQQSQGASQGSSQASDQRQGRGAMNPQNMQTMRTFSQLVMLDQQEGLSLTKAQATAMLPIVEASVSSNELTADNQTKLLEILTADQKKFIEASAAQMQQRPNGTGMNNGDQGQPGTGTKPNTAGQPTGSEPNNQAGQPNASAQPNPNNSGKPTSSDKGQGNNSDRSNNQTPPNNQGGNGPQGGRGGGINNSGQTLLELLQAKVK